MEHDATFRINSNKYPNKCTDLINKLLKSHIINEDLLPNVKI